MPLIGHGPPLRNDRAGQIKATIVGSGEEETLVKALAGMGIKAKR